MTLINILWMVIILVISLSIVLIIPKIREIENRTLKTVVYIVLGLVIFTMVGFAFNMWGSSSPDPKDIVAPYREFYPMLILALAIAATVLVTYMEKDNYGYFFASTGFAVMLPNIYLYVFQNGRFDLALLGCAVWAIIPAGWAFVWRSVAATNTTTWEKVTTALKAAFLTYPVYLLTAAITVFGKSSRYIDSGIVEALASAVPDIIMFILWTVWLYFLFTVIIITLEFMAHDLALQLLNYRRVAGPKGIKYVKIVPEGAVAAPKPKVNHYAALIDEMQVFSKYVGEMDRIKAASTIGRFKSEYQTLAVKYNEDSKSEAEKMIKMIELEFMKKY